MSRDFTFNEYRALVNAGQDVDYEFLTVRDYLSTEELPERFIIMRHDVDRKPANSLKMARLEADEGISSTYYFRTINKAFKPDMIREVERLGHEVGYHYEDMDRADGDVSEAHDSFTENLNKLRELCTIDTMCMHGNPLTSHDNRDMWNDAHDFEEYGLLGEAYLSMDFTDVTYYSDTGRTWQDGELKIKDHTMGEGNKEIGANTTGDLIAILRESRVPRTCLLTHPNRWADGPAELVSEYLKDKSVNVAKHGLNFVR